ncbi:MULTISPECIES: hypothetical protein [unclassified Gemella]|uniref:hypothetical protein n=1 Tax=unclassified Gemella TaxID=2624949 RepID=UPI0014302348|nr:MULTISPECIES: hypothetical protein [unclassified Gemella]MBF0710573.1 hypothetical protein [Gemella sp. GL1.1]MBF0746448.1 hypothetical protein [Gemella sp. 19428wG2_WT2a]NYS27917.1 hypothetical protein [Gemella sp. GL1]
MTDKESKEVVKNLIYYYKDGILKRVEAPEYGEVTFIVKEGEVKLYKVLSSNTA